jgi:hypothetical protein
MSLAMIPFIKIWASLTQNQIRIESDSVQQRPQNLELHEHDYSGIVPALVSTYTPCIYMTLTVDTRHLTTHSLSILTKVKTQNKENFIHWPDLPNLAQHII